MSEAKFFHCASFHTILMHQLRHITSTQIELPRLASLTSTRPTRYLTRSFEFASFSTLQRTLRLSSSLRPRSPFHSFTRSMSSSSSSSTSSSSPSPSSPIVIPSADKPSAESLQQPLSLTPRQLQIYETALNSTVHEGRHIILYDGVCLVCNSTVNFIVDRDSQGLFNFATLQSDFGRYVRSTLTMPDIDSMFLVEGGHGNAMPFYSRSTAMLRIGARLEPKWFFALAWLLLLIPAVLRDAGYKAFASMRYRLFGYVDPQSCRALTKAIRPRFFEYRLKDMEKEYERQQKESKEAASQPIDEKAQLPIASNQSKFELNDLLEQASTEKQIPDEIASKLRDLTQKPEEIKHLHEAKQMREKESESNKTNDDNDDVPDDENAPRQRKGKKESQTTAE